MGSETYFRKYKIEADIRFWGYGLCIALFFFIPVCGYAFLNVSFNTGLPDKIALHSFVLVFLFFCILTVFIFKKRGKNVELGIKYFLPLLLLPVILSVAATLFLTFFVLGYLSFAITLFASSEVKHETYCTARGFALPRINDAFSMNRISGLGLDECEFHATYILHGYSWEHVGTHWYGYEMKTHILKP